MKALLRGIVELLTQLIALVRHNRQLNPQAERVVKINLGCGLSIAPGWINVDGSLNALVASWPHFSHRLFYRFSGANQYYSRERYCSLLVENEFVHHDLSRSIPFVSESVDFIYTSHFLEHLTRAEGARLLRESFRVLRPGGILRVCVPDLAYAVGLYAGGAAVNMLENYFFVADGGSRFARHKYMYDFPLLKSALELAKFNDVRRCSFKVGAIPDCALLDNNPDETLYVEARKPK